MKLNAGNGRAPSGMFDVPDRAQDLMHKVDKTYNLWYRIWCDEYIPIIVKRQIWHNEEENLEENDIVYFKLTDSPLSPNWIIGKIDHTIKSKDGKVRTVGISYKHDTENGERKFRIVERPVRQTVKLMNIDETSLIDDIRKVHESASKRFDDQKLIREETFDYYLDETFGRDCNIVWKNSCSAIYDKLIAIAGPQLTNSTSTQLQLVSWGPRSGIIINYPSNHPPVHPPTRPPTHPHAKL